MNRDGSGLTRLTRDLRSQGQPSWHPDGQRIVFGATTSGKSDLFVIGVDGQGLRRLTSGTYGTR
jgi:Tol biopolymer transport system component